MSKLFPRLPAHRRAGYALVMVLLCLVLLVALSVGFFTSMTNDRRAAHVDASALSVRKLADSTLSLVISQIKDGSAGRLNASDPASPPVAWISQPGLIRTFAAAEQLRAYKLYSSPAMVVSGAFDPQTDTPPANWASCPSLYTDLNSPINISDPNGTVTKDSQTYTTIYPVIDPAASSDYPTVGANPDGVKGFLITGAPTTTGANPAPMPVQWLYQLKDGALIPADPTSTAIATFANAASQPSVTNPIVARIAFWTDDDSCKVNVNTAAGDEWSPAQISVNGNTAMDIPGSYWETPRFYSAFDQFGLQSYIQAKNEFERYPGHPATTYLSAVFPWLTRQDIAQIAPRVQATGGSLGGTAPASAVIIADSDRLYASIDELAFQQPASNPLRPLQGSSVLTTGQIQRARFFLTAHSKAPELNLFGGPRIGVWPQWEDPNKRTAFDKLIAFCSTIGNGTSAKTYFFTRTDPSKPTVDATLSRNPNLYAYLQNHTSQAPPGFTGNFLSKYGADRDQVLTEIFDYIRTVNLVDSSQGGFAYADGLNGSAPSVGFGTVIPIEIGATRGLGRFPINNQLAICFWANSVDASNRTIQMTPYLILSKFCPMQGFANMFPNLDERISGLDSFQISFDNGVTWQSLGFSASTTYTCPSSYWTDQGARSFGGNMGMGVEFYNQNKKNAIRTPGNPFPGDGYPFAGPAIALPVGKTVGSESTFLIKSGPISMSIAAVGQSSPIQSASATFPQTTMYVPAKADWAYDFTNRRQYGNYFFDQSGPADSIKGLELGGANIQGDFRLAGVRKVIPVGEFTPHLLYSSTTTIQATSLRNDQGQSPGAGWAQWGIGPQMFGAMNPAIPYQSAYGAPNTVPYPDFPSSLSQSANGGARLQLTVGNTAPGDWDNGIGDAREGAYAGKADEGATGNYPYYGGLYSGSPTTNTTFSPNRQLASPVAFGSLPTGFARNMPWQTLLFCPNPAAGTILDNATGRYIANHPGRTSPADYLLLDLFTMPVVEPYAISEPFATGGKINVNYQIAPFTYIKRDTGLRAVLRSTRVTAVDTNDVSQYHFLGNYQKGPNYRYPVNLDETLADFDRRFLDNRPLISASEICDMFLVPDLNGSGKTGQPTGNSGSKPIRSWWYSGGAGGKGFYLTGDNMREKPYADIYPRLTTQSNTYTVHVRVQKIVMPKGIRVGTWEETIGNVEGEYRGSYTVERFIDPNDPRFATGNPNYLDADTANLNQAYKFRIVETKKFAP